jgi:hypothetical protein
MDGWMDGDLLSMARDQLPKGMHGMTQLPHSSLVLFFVLPLHVAGLQATYNSVTMARASPSFTCGLLLPFYPLGILFPGAVLLYKPTLSVLSV